MSELMPGESPPDWMHLMLQAPEPVVIAVMEFLEGHGYREIDFCVLERPEDYSQVHFGPAEVLTNQYPIDWRTRR